MCALTFVPSADEYINPVVTVERLVSWLLEHPDVAISDSDTFSSFDALSDTDSVSEDVEEGISSAGVVSMENSPCSSINLPTKDQYSEVVAELWFDIFLINFSNNHTISFGREFSKRCRYFCCD